MNILRKLSIQKSSTSKKTATILLSVIFLAGLFILSISIGTVKISFLDVIDSLIGNSPNSKYEIIIRHVRLPRTIAAVLSGSALTVSGAILQNVLNNNLAAPNIIGVNSGAGLFTIALCAFFPAHMNLMPIAAFLGAILAVAFVYSLAKFTGATRTAMVLSGIAVSAFFSSITDTILTLYPNTAIGRIDFLIGSFSGISMADLRLPAVMILIGLAVALVFSYELNIMSLGNETALSLGLRSTLFRAIFFGAAAILAGSVVSFAGLIGFVGLIVPHVARIFVGNDNRLLIPFCIVGGASFTLICDMVARTLFSPFEIPVGIVMSFVGAPFFIYLIICKKRRLSSD